MLSKYKTSNDKIILLKSWDRQELHKHNIIVEKLTDLTTLKFRFCTEKDTLNKIRRPKENQEKIPTIHNRQWVKSHNMSFYKSVRLYKHPHRKMDEKHEYAIHLDGVQMAQNTYKYVQLCQ